MRLRGRSRRPQVALLPSSSASRSPEEDVGGAGTPGTAFVRAKADHPRRAARDVRTAEAPGCSLCAAAPGVTSAALGYPRVPYLARAGRDAAARTGLANVPTCVGKQGPFPPANTSLAPTYDIPFTPLALHPLRMQNFLLASILRIPHIP